MTGRLVDLSMGMNRKQRITVEVNEDFQEQFGKLKDADLDIEIKKHRNRRSLDANSYYWVLITKAAKKLRISNNRAHNIMLRRYGAPEVIDDKLVYLVLPDVDEAEEKALESETYHIRPTSQVRAGNDGKLYRTYIMLKGSSAYDTAEMSRLINGIVDECKMMGIETMPPDKLKALLEVWE
jgi:hypothetical protein